jgi:hypothetical protein
VGVDHIHAALQTFGSVERNTAHFAFTQVGLNFKHNRSLAGALNLDRVKDLGHIPGGELGVNDATQDLNYFSICHVSSGYLLA